MSLQEIHLICLVWVGIALVTFFLLRFVKAPYGRHVKQGWGPQIDNKLGWILMELPSFALILFFLLSYSQSNYASFLMMLWLLHYTHRTFVFPFRIRTRDKKMPIVIVLSAIFFNLVNAGLNGYYLTFFDDYGPESFMSWNFILGIGVFGLGAGINLKSDQILIQLRKPAETGYKIPRGFLFDYVSCPNLLGELVQWGGFALMAWNCPAVTFFLWTGANLIPRALDHHRWYKEKFDDYPRKRRAVFPFIL